MTRDLDAQLAEDQAMVRRADALLDRILDGLPARDQAEELVFLLGGPFGVDWRTGREPHEAPPAAWEPIVLELGEPVAVAFHLDQGRPGGGHRPAQEPQLGDPEGDKRSVVEVEADEVAPSLRWATAKPQRAARNGEAKPGGDFNDDPPF